MTLFELDHRDDDAERVMAALMGPPRHAATSRLVEWALEISGELGGTAGEIHARIDGRRSLGSVRIVLDGLRHVHDPAGRPAIATYRRGRATVYRVGPGWAPPHAGIFRAR